MEHPSRPATLSPVDRIGGLRHEPGAEPGVPSFDRDLAVGVTTGAACGARMTERRWTLGSACGASRSCSDHY